MNVNIEVVDRVVHSIDTSSVYRNNVEVFRLERQDDGRGVWGLYPIVDGVKAEIIDLDKYSNDLLARIELGKYDADLEKARQGVKKVV